MYFTAGIRFTLCPVVQVFYSRCFTPGGVFTLCCTAVVVFTLCCTAVAVFALCVVLQAWCLHFVVL
jgi:hypothetical protein